MLPRKWIDGVLPLTIKPDPKKIQRVFVARLEVLAPATEQALLQILDQTLLGKDLAAQASRINQLEMGRFLNAGFQRAIDLRKQQMEEAAIQLKEEIGRRQSEAH